VKSAHSAVPQPCGPGWRLTGLASSWAAFTVHAALFLKPTRRLGLVLRPGIARGGAPGQSACLEARR
jgi:hypothetical protein